MSPAAPFALLMCAFAAHRLLRWDAKIAKDCAWLDAVFGASSEHPAIAERHAWLSVATDVAFAAVAAVL